VCSKRGNGPHHAQLLGPEHLGRSFSRLRSRPSCVAHNDVYMSKACPRMGSAFPLDLGERKWDSPLKADRNMVGHSSGVLAHNTVGRIRPAPLVASSGI
jgi:hypothetical protein